jgi:hypothetical protein
MLVTMLGEVGGRCGAGEKGEVGGLGGCWSVVSRSSSLVGWG